MDSIIAILFSQSMLVGLIVAISASLLGVFVVLRKMSLVGDAFSHIALPGFALAVIYNFNPFFGGFVFLLVGIILIVWLEKVSVVSIETSTAILFTASLAFGLLIMPSMDLVESLFGDISKITRFDIFLSFLVSIFIFIFFFLFFNKFVKITLSYDFAKAEKVDITDINIIFLFMLGMIIALGMKIVGVLLMGALIILPASIARNFSQSLKELVIFSVVIGIIMVIVGIGSSVLLGIPSGPAIILSGAFLFILSVIFKKR